jgi:hypothetical protein
MKVVSMILLVLILPAASYSQGVFSNTTNSALQKVIEDYPNKFSNIKGDLLAENIQTSDFSSRVEIPGISCILTQYSSTNKAVYSWRADFGDEEEFDEAKRQYKELYNQIRNTIIKIQGEKPFILNGAYQAPALERKFNVINFQLLPSGGEMEKLQVELSMSYMVTSWKVTLTVFEREFKDDERITASDR